MFYVPLNALQAITMPVAEGSSNTSCTCELYRSTIFYYFLPIDISILTG
jgi:hypothetical protein